MPKTYDKPLPRVTPDNEAFWQGCRQGELRLAKCEDCAKVHLPPGPVCPFCLSDRLGWQKASGNGVVSSWTVVHQAWFPAFKAELPYNVVQVELAEGPRLTANLVEVANDAIKIGMAVEVVFDAVTQEVTLPRFRPAR